METTSLFRLRGETLKRKIFQNILISESKKIEEFDEYMFRLQPTSNTRNPWFGEYWHKLTDCQKGDNLTPHCQQVNVPRIGNMILRKKG